jgi:hypothetical protein
MSFKSRLMFLPLAFSLVLSGVASAESFDKHYAYVSKVNVAEDNFLYINVSGNFSFDHGCIHPFFARSEHSLVDEQTKAWLAIALESFRSHKQVWVVTNGCTSNGYLILTKLQIEQD